jgi:hypothetical protein
MSALALLMFLNIPSAVFVGTSRKVARCILAMMIALVGRVSVSVAVADQWGLGEGRSLIVPGSDGEGFPEDT